MLKCLIFASLYGFKFCNVGIRDAHHLWIYHLSSIHLSVCLSVCWSIPLKLESQVIFSCPCGCWESNSDLLQERYTVDFASSLQPFFGRSWDSRPIFLRFAHSTTEEDSWRPHTCLTLLLYRCGSTALSLHRSPLHATYTVSCPESSILNLAQPLPPFTAVTFHGTIHSYHPHSIFRN